MPAQQPIAQQPIGQQPIGQQPTIGQPITAGQAGGIPAHVQAQVDTSTRLLLLASAGMSE